MTDRRKRPARTGIRFFGALGLVVLLLSGCVQDGQQSDATLAVQPEPVMRVDRGTQLASVSGKYLAGRYARRKRDYEIASDYLSDALSIDTNNSQIRRQAFFSLIAVGRMPEAAVLATKIVEDKKGSPIANLSVAIEDLVAGRYQKAVTRLRSMPKRGMNTFTAPLILAWSLAAQNKIEEARTSLDALKKIRSFAALRYLHLGLILQQSGQTAEAEEQFKAASSASQSLRVTQAYGHFLERAGRGDDAKALYEKFRARDDDSDSLDEAMARLAEGRLPEPFLSNAMDGVAEVFFNLAGTLSQGRSTDLALIYGRLALRLRPDFPLAQLMVGGLLESMNRRNEAMVLYKSVKPESTLSWSARMRRASTLDDLGRSDDAMALLRKMATERKDRFQPLVRLGDLMRAKKRYGEAIEAYGQAIARIPKLDKTHWSLLYARGISYERAKNWPDAEVDFLRALDLRPDQPFVLNYLGYSWVDLGMNLERAKKMIRRAVELRPNDGYIVDSLGWVLYQLGDYKEAARQLERAVVLRPEDPTINDHLGDAYWRVGRSLEARFQWRRALSLDPEKDMIPAIEKKLQRGLAENASGENHG
jgi:tetratricopeptide (TPR) repeat protein